MNIQDALQETGKAYILGGTNYAEVNNSNELVWYSMGKKERESAVSFYCILDETWMPYHEVKEIRPENAGELWRYQDRFTWFTHAGEYMNNILMTCQSGGEDRNVNLNEMSCIHGEDGWERLVPPVEDDSVERIEIEGVYWQQHNFCTPFSAVDNTQDFESFSDFIGKPPMKMILEIPKDNHES